MNVTCVSYMDVNYGSHCLESWATAIHKRTSKFRVLQFTNFIGVIKIKITLRFGLYTDMNGSQFLCTVFMFNQASE